MILGQVTKIDQFSAARRNGVLCEKKKNKKQQWQLDVDVFIKLLF